MTMRRKAADRWPAAPLAARSEPGSARSGGRLLRRGGPAIDGAARGPAPEA